VRDQLWQNVKVVTSGQHPRECDAVAVNNHLRCVTHYDRDAIAGDIRGAISLQLDRSFLNKSQKETNGPSSYGWLWKVACKQQIVLHDKWILRVAQRPS
jgi:hypothetical protein